MTFTSRKVKVIRENSIGVPMGTYDSVECPDDKKDKYADDCWIMHPTRNEPCRVYVEGQTRNPEAKYL